MREFTIIKIYLGVISVITFVGLIVNLGVLGNEVLSKAFITDEEYITQNNYRITSCDTENAPTKEGITAAAKTPAEIEKCKADAKKEMINERNYSAKRDMVSGLTWGILFLLAFLLHFPMLLKKSGKE